MGYHGDIYIYIHTMRGVRRWLPGWMLPGWILLGHYWDICWICTISYGLKGRDWNIPVAISLMGPRSTTGFWEPENFGLPSGND